MSKKTLICIFFIIVSAVAFSQEQELVPELTLESAKEQYEDTPWENVFSIGLAYFRTLDLNNLAQLGGVDALGFQYGWFSGRKLGFYFEGTLGIIIAPIGQTSGHNLTFNATTINVNLDPERNFLGTTAALFMGLGGYPHSGDLFQFFFAGGIFFNTVHYMPIIIDQSDNRSHFSFGFGPAVNVRFQFKLNQIVSLNFGGLIGYSYNPIVWTQETLGSTHSLVFIPSFNAVFSWKDSSKQVQLYGW